jgi:ribosomal protein L11 methyltransferase
VNRISASPYGDLHIYYLKGRVAEDQALAVESFIGNWQEEEDAFLFFHRPDDEAVAALVGRQPHLTVIDRFRMSYAEWHGGTIGPLTIGSLTIVPPWFSGAAHAPNPILLDPGVVFGTGTHPTTRHCLTALQSAFARQPISTVLDVGTGTGLLAIAAAQLGARRVAALDLNRLAVATAKRNVDLNAMAARILVLQGNAKNFIDLSCDLMVSNIHYAVMRELVQAPAFVRHRQFILSGLLRSQAREIELLLHRRASTILNRWSQEDIWFTIWGQNAQLGVDVPSGHKDGSGK